MDNMELIKSAIDYIFSYTKERHISQMQISKLCPDGITQGTISNMFKNPTRTTISTLISVCNGLNLNLSDIFREIEKANFSKQCKFIYDINDVAFDGHIGNYHIYFLPTTPNNKILYHHGILSLEDPKNIGKCCAHLELDTGDKTNAGTNFIKKYDGQLVISKTGCAYIDFISPDLGDMWFLVINHNYLNNKKLLCTLANAVTSSAGKVRYPTMHRAIISRTELDEKILSYIRGLLLISNENIIISTKKVNEFFKDGNLSDKDKNTIKGLVDNSETFISLSKNMIKSTLADSEYAYVIANLLNYSISPVNNKITNDEDAIAYQIIDDYTKNKSFPKNC